MQYQYSQTQVFDLPPFESDTKLQSFESFSRVDWTVSAGQSLHRVGDGVAAQDDVRRA